MSSPNSSSDTQENLNLQFNNGESNIDLELNNLLTNLNLNHSIIDENDHNNEANIISNNGVAPFNPQDPIFNPAGSHLPLTGIPQIPPVPPPAAVAEEPILQNPNNPHNYQNLPNLEINNGIRPNFIPAVFPFPPAGIPPLPPFPPFPPFRPLQPPAAFAEEPIWQNPNNLHNGVIPYPAVFPFPPAGIPPLPPFQPPADVVEMLLWPNPNNPPNFENLPNLEINNEIIPHFNPADFPFPPPEMEEIPPFPLFQPPANVVEELIWWNLPNNLHNFENLPNLEINNEVDEFIFFPPNNQFPHGGFIHHFPQPPQLPPAADNNAVIDPQNRWLNLIDSLPENTPIHLLQSQGLIELMKNVNALDIFKSILFRFHIIQPGLAGPDITGLINIAQTVTSNKHTFLDLATHQYGVKSLIALLRRFSIVDNIIYKAVCNNFLDLMTSNYSHYLIISTLQAMNQPKRKQICKLIYKNLIILATHEKGYIGLKRLFPKMRGTYRYLTVKSVKDNALGLAFHKYGTYVVQEILDLKEDVTSEGIARNLKGNFFELSILKEGSYVVQKCLMNRSGREIVLEEILSDKERLMEVAMDEFGSYVVVYGLCEEKLSGMKEMLEEFMEILRSGIEDLKIGHGKNVAKFIEIFGNGDEIDEMDGYRRMIRLKKRRH